MTVATKCGRATVPLKSVNDFHVYDRLGLKRTEYFRSGRFKMALWLESVTSKFDRSSNTSRVQNF